jgi:hypothetical protein
MRLFFSRAVRPFFSRAVRPFFIPRVGRMDHSITDLTSFCF